LQEKQITYGVYLHRSTIDGVVFYIGKFKKGGKKGYDRPHENHPNRRNKEWIEYVKSIDNKYIVEIVAEFEDESEAFKLEYELQQQYWAKNEAKCCHLYNDEWRKNNVDNNWKNKEVRKRIGANKKGKIMPIEQRLKISQTLKGRYLRENNPNKREVVQLTADGCVIKEFLSLSDAAREVDGDTGHIAAVCKGRHKTHKGYIWQYKDVS